MKPDVGYDIPRLSKTPSSIAMFRLSAVMWNAHRTHIDHPYATGPEGHASTLVQDYMLGAYMVEMLMNWAGVSSRFKRFTYSNRGPVHANTTVSCWGRITGVEPVDDDQVLVSLDIGVDNESGLIAVPGTAQLLVSRKNFETMGS